MSKKKDWNYFPKKRGQNFSSGSIIKTQSAGAKAFNKGRAQFKYAETEKKIGKAGHVYIFSLGYKCYYKIGCTTNIESRLKALQASNPLVKCVWSAWVKDMREVEKILHDQFEKYWIDREVFELTREDITKANDTVNKIKEEYAVY